MTVHGSPPVPVLRAQGAQARLSTSTTHTPRSCQAETGGGFGGKEEYPSMIALHAALLARKAGRPVRMIYDRHEDLAATTKRHPAIIRHRTGVTARRASSSRRTSSWSWTAARTATLTPVVLSRGTLHAGGPYAARTSGSAAARVATNTPPNGAFRGFGAPQTEFAAEMQVNRVAEAIGMSPARAPAPQRLSIGDVTPTGQVLRDERRRRRGPRAEPRRPSEFERVRAQTAAASGAARGPAANGRRAASGSRWPGTAPGSPARAR